MISTDSSLIPVSTVNAAFATPEVYWAKPMPEDDMRDMLDNSLCFGMFVDEGSVENSNEGAQKKEEAPTPEKETSLKLMGLARCITDFHTFIYLTDVYISPPYQGKGLGSWLIQCVQEVIESMPHLRRSLLFTGDWERSVPFYERLMGMTVLESKPGKGLATMMRPGRANQDTT